MTSNSITTQAVKTGTGFSFWLRAIFLDWDKLQFTGSLLLILLCFLSPLVVKSPYYLNMIIMTALFAFIGLGWNIIGGFTGQLFIGYCTFFGIGAYATIVPLVRLNISPWFGLIFSGVIAALIGWAVSYITLRYGLKLDYLALFSNALMIGMGLILRRVEYFGGATGIWVSFREDIPRNMEFLGKQPYVYITATLLLLGTIVHYIVYRSKMGRFLIAIREDEDAAAAVGVNIAKYKTYALMLACAIAGVAGGFYAIYTNYISPPLVFSIPLNVEFLTPAIIGGRGTVIGPILGALLNKPASEMLRAALAGEVGLTLVGYGVFLIVFILFLPKGVAGLIQIPYEKLRRYLLNRWG